MSCSVVLKYKNEDDCISFEKPSQMYMQRLQKILDDCMKKKNGYVCVDISKPRKPRTTGEGSQNNLFWALVTLIANEVGDDSEGMSDTENGLKMRAIGRGYPFHINKITCEKVPESTTKVDTVQMSYLIDTAIQECAELEIVIPANIGEMKNEVLRKI